MLLGAIIARSSLPIYRSSHLTWLDEVRQANTITYPPLSSSPLHKHTPPTPHVFWPFVERPDIAALLTLTVHRLLAELSQGGTLTCLTQSGRPISQQHLLLAKNPPFLRSPMLISNRLENGNSQRDKNMQIVVFPRFLLSQVDLSAKRRFVFMCCYYCCVCHHFSATHQCCVCHCWLCFQELVVFSRACCI